jgi:hypothetical protein
MMGGGGRSSFLSARLRAQETAFTREQDLHAYKSIRDALKGTGQLEAARERVDKVHALASSSRWVLATRASLLRQPCNPATPRERR